MTGRIIDRIGLCLLGAAAAYLLFLNAGCGIAASCALTMLCACLAGYVLKYRPRRHRCTAAQARAAVYAIACMDDASAAAAMQRLLDADGESAARTVAVVRHPRALLSSGEVFAAWRNNRGCPSLRVAATCPAGPQAVRMAAELYDPRVTVADSRCLMRIIRRTGLCVPPEAPRRAPYIRRAIRALSARRASPRMLLHGLGMLGMYLLLGNDLYLFAAMFVLYATGCLWIRNGMPRRGQNG